MVKRALSIIGCTALLVLGLGSLGGAPAFGAGSQAKPASGSEVKIDNFSFAPAAVAVSVGTAVTWINRDDIPHTVVSSDQDKVFKSKVLDTDDKFSYTFTKAGTYPYFCSLHPKMVGRIVVQ